MQTYIVDSYYEEAQDRWYPKFIIPFHISKEENIIMSEPVDFRSKYFKTKEEADNFTKKFLLDFGISEEQIIIK